MEKPRALRSRNRCEAAVRSLRVLMTGYQLWGLRSWTEITELAAILRVPKGELDVVVGELLAEGLIRLDADERNIALTHKGVCALELQPPTLPM